MEKSKEYNILYEDNHLLVVHKFRNIPTCEDESHDKDLLTLLKEYLKVKYQKKGNVYLGLVHRIDRPTEGILVFAKTSKSAKRLSEQIKNNTIKKTYYAVVTGKLKKKEDTFTDYLIKDKLTNTSFPTNSSLGKLAILDYKLICQKDNLNLVKINLHTGRHHQIRVQFAIRGNPLYGDHRYNINVKRKDKSDLALIAKKLSFYHPTKKELLTFEIDLPKKYPWNIF